MSTSNADTDARTAESVLTPADISWRDGRPFAAAFDDIYGAADGSSEVQRVFLRPSQILERARSVPCVQVAELGFGTGLNFVVLASEIVKRTSTNLHFISFEAHPLSAATWREFAGRDHADPVQNSLYWNLANHPPPLLPGWHRRRFCDGRIQLSVFHGDVSDGLDELLASQRQAIDSWWLDGFSPVKNPAMWSAHLWSKLARLSTHTTYVVSFTAAGAVRRGLTAAGFSMEKIDQRPYKRASIVGRYCGPITLPIHTPPAHVRIAGGGIAGATAARLLAEQNIKVTVYEPNALASGGSKMPSSLLHTRLLGDGSAEAELRCRAFHWARNFLGTEAALAASGALQLPRDKADVGKLERIYARYAEPDGDAAAWIQWIDRAELQDRFQLPAALLTVLPAPIALWFPTAAVINLPELCHSLLDHAHIEVMQSALPPRDHAGTNSRLTAAILANADAAKAYCPELNLETGEVGGQLDWITPPNTAVSVPVVGQGYMIPSTGHWTIGSTYEQRPWASADASASNLEKNRLLLNVADAESAQTLLHHYKRAARCVASDRIPVVGRIDETTWISTAHSSMGTSSAPMAAAIIVSDLLGWVQPVSARVAKCLQPQRFLARQARRGIKYIGSQKDTKTDR